MKPLRAAVNTTRRGTLALAVLCTAAAFLWLVWSGWDTFEEANGHIVRLQAALHLHGALGRLEEVTAMSAALAVEGGEAVWVERFRLAEPELQRTIYEIQYLLPKVGQRFRWSVGIAHASLAATEERAIALMGVRPGYARSLLRGEAFQSARTAFARGTVRLDTEMDAELAAQWGLTRRRLSISIAVGFAGLVLASVLWVAVSIDRRRRVVAETRVEEALILSEKMTARSLQDSLSGLGNRRYFQERLEQALARRDRRPDSIAVMFIDLDDFKSVNDSVGHGAGDALLRDTADRLRACVRPSDTIARLGGDEFAVLIDDAPEPGYAERLAQRLVEATSTTLLSHGKAFAVRASIGLAVSSPTHRTAEDLLRDADIAMYEAKGQGKARFVIFDPDMHRELADRLSLQADLDVALERGEFVLHYQPIVTLDDLRITGFEALVRWQHPQRGLLGPDAFVPIAESTGLIGPLGQWVLETAFRQLSAWRMATRDDLGMNVNVSVRQLEEATFLADLATLRGAYDVPSGALTLEVTETALIRDGGVAFQACHLVKELGFRLALDDFGTGFSSISHLRRLPVDIVKIDRSFIGEIDTNPTDGSLVGSIVRLSQALGLATTAEGVEQRGQLDDLRALGCTSAQGNLFYPAMSVAEIDALLAAAVRERVGAA